MTTALARCFIRKHPLEAPKSAEDTTDVSKHIAIVDIGHATTSVSVVKLTRAYLAPYCLLDVARVANCAFALVL